jgi:flagellar M-ring protein FliF
MASFSDVIKQGREFWSSRNTQQKGFLLAGAGATLLLLVMFVRFIDTPDYKPLFTGLEAADAQTIATQLDAEGIPHQASADGKILSVPANKLDEARLKTAGQSGPHSGRMGFELFDKVSWGQTEFDQKVTYQRALEGELERTIETISDVESARVHLVMPTDSVFLDKQRAAKASVILKLRGRGLPKQAALTISKLVSGAVDELSPEDVSIVDAESARSLNVRPNGDDGEGLETTLTQRLISTLEPVVGADKIRASVNVDHNPGSSEESKEEYDPAVSALLSTQKSEETASPGAGAVGIPGTASNTPTSKEEKTVNPPVQVGGQSSKTETAQYGVNKLIVRTLMPAGRIERVTAAILVDDATIKNVQGGKTTYTHRKRTAEELSKIRQLAEAVVGFDAKRGDTISVENMSFDSMSAEADLPAPNWLDQGRKTVSDYSSVLRPVSLLVVFLLAYLLVVRPVQKQALKPALSTAAAAQPVLAPGVHAEQLGAGAVEPEDDSRRAAQLKEQTIGLIRQKPVNTARALQTWLREEPS